MDITGVLQQVDDYYEQNRGEEAEKLMRDSIAQAVQEQDDESLLQLLNELMGYYRETSQVDASYAIANQALQQAKRMGLEGTLPYATTLLNMANAYRAGGSLRDSMDCYEAVRKVYDKILKSDNMLVASLENNISLLYQEMGAFKEAKTSLLKALAIVEANRAEFEIAVTHANLASTCSQLGEVAEAHIFAKRAMQEFEDMGVEDAHYGAALSALGSYYFEKKDFVAAEEIFSKAAKIMEQNLGRNEYYERLQENIKACRNAGNAECSAGAPGAQDSGLQGLALCRKYYEVYVAPMIEEKFGAYVHKIAVGLAGEGSDCFGYDDALSMDHDWGPDICLWVTDETYARIGEALQEAYEQLPDEFMGFKRTVSARGRGRRGVMTIAAFYQRLLQTAEWEEIDWQQVPDASLAAAVNGAVFRDDEGIFDSFRKKLKQGYPEQIRYLKIAESAAKFSRAGQYNYFRVLKRGDAVSASLMLAESMEEAMKLLHYVQGTYPPHEKWLYRSLQDVTAGKELCSLLAKLETCARRIVQETVSPEKAWLQTMEKCMEQTATFLADTLYERNYISDSDNYLDAHTAELLFKAMACKKTDEELVEDIAELEYEAFDKVRNVGGRAFCQNDWPTFSIMRKSQYLTWNRTMLLQYLYDFDREYRKGHNLITEKYGRMMESTAPEEYEQLKEHFPVLSEEKKRIIEQIVQLQVAWMEEFAAKYPHLADNARSVRSAEDNLHNTSYETYLRGEISTYSDKMLELYGRYIVEYATQNRNLTFVIMENSVHLYGYADLDRAESVLENDIF